MFTDENGKMSEENRAILLLAATQAINLVQAQTYVLHALLNSGREAMLTVVEHIEDPEVKAATDASIGKISSLLEFLDNWSTDESEYT